MSVSELTNNEFEEFIKEGIVLIDFFADWCMPCLTMSPIIDELSEKFKGKIPPRQEGSRHKIKFGKVNVGDNQELAQKFNVSSIPNFVLLKDGKVIEQFIGSMSEEELEEKINNSLEQ